VAGLVTEDFENLYRTTRGEILSFLLRRVSQPADAADLLSEVYMVAWRRRQGLPEDPRLWLYGVARTVLKAHHRQGKARGGLAERLRTQIEEQYVVDDGYLYVKQVLDQLPSRDRELMELAVFEQLSPAEIAVVLRRRSGTVRVQLHRARERLRAIITADEALADQLAPRDGS
jgi:RNA polymerase sigma-70 factor (ECF subfamily)